MRTKLERIVLAPAGNADAAALDALDALGDLAGVRIATFVEAGREPMVAAIQGAFRDVDVEVKDRPDRFYRGTHCQLRFSREDALDVPPELLGLSCEVQVCSLLAQVWNEVEHGLVYAVTGEASPEEQAALHALGRLTEAGDALVTVLLTLEGKPEQ